MNRHSRRIVIVRVLYELDIRKIETIDDDTIFNIINFAFDPTVDFENYLLNEENEDFNYIKDVINNIFNSQSELDLIITNNLDKYTIDRLNFVDRAIIRLAVYEMCNSDLAHSIIINEAVEITKEYSNLDDGLQSKFNNRLLDKISQDLKK